MSEKTDLVDIKSLTDLKNLSDREIILAIYISVDRMATHIKSMNGKVSRHNKFIWIISGLLLGFGVKLFI